MKHRIIQLSGLLAIALLVVGAVASRNLYVGTFVGNGIGLTNAAGNGFADATMAVSGGHTNMIWNGNGNTEAVGSFISDGLLVQGEYTGSTLRNGIFVYLPGPPYTGNVLSFGHNSAGTYTSSLSHTMALGDAANTFTVLNQSDGTPSGTVPVMYWFGNGNVSVSGSITATNGFGVLRTNGAPSNVTIGVTAPDNWVAFTNTDGVKMFMPAWKNH